MLPNLEYLNLSRNALQGGIPSSIGDISQLWQLDLSSNNFSREIPEHLAVGCVTLQVLKLSNNSLRGQIFPAFNSSWLEYLYLDNNKFTGEILDGISKCLILKALNIGNNYIFGRVPSWLGNLKLLRTLVMRNNSLEGQIPKQISKLYKLAFFDLSQNNLSGSIPSWLNLPNLRYIHLQGNGFSGSIPKSVLNNSYLITFDIRDNYLSGSIPDSDGALSNLRILLLRGNQLNGPIPSHLCQLSKIGIMDLSHNTFSGSIPPCFSNIAFGRISATEHAFMQESMGTGILRSLRSYTYGNQLGKEISSVSIYQEFNEQEEVEFITKSMSSSYKGDILNLMSGLDLSCNHLTGDIPREIGKLSEVRALNLSHNHLTGSIPENLSNLKQIESLDLSHNKLSGGVPSELTGLYYLAVFTVSYNNLSGKTPDMEAQFGTFSNTSYEGNPFLCGPPLEKNCTTVESRHTKIEPYNEGREDKFDIDFAVFYASFTASYMIFLLGFAALLYINPYWRRMWFDLIDTCIHSCFRFVSKSLYKLLAFRVCN
ncbi:hypothetical protein HHK36_021375 [Tetracentron sinense]|uniref:Uncharacterized protein n=1 Tax=Tetracentron sinense TaxID=13715 RepID=A0A834YPM0_TETSI|nr:hypothetical protein HHK36_021375 [Tetracentron sinense]